MGVGGAYSFVACLSHLTIDHAALSRRSTGGISNIFRSHKSIGLAVRVVLGLGDGGGGGGEEGAGRGVT